LNGDIYTSALGQQRDWLGLRGLGYASALGQKWRLHRSTAMSALPSKRTFIFSYRAR